MMNLLLTASEQQGMDTVTMISQYGVLILMLVLGYFVLIRPSKKREKEQQEMRKHLQVGDEVITSGGIIGRVVSQKDDTVLIETGSDRSKIRIARWAIQTNTTAMEAAEQQRAQQEEQKKLEGKKK